MIVVSKDWKHRFDLWEMWDYKKPFVLFIGLNPSTRFNGGLVTRCKNLAKEWGYGGTHIVNLFSYRTSSPKELAKYHHPNDGANDKKIKELVEEAGLIVACWGNLGVFKDRDRKIKMLIYSMGKEIHHLGLTQYGCPRHAAYVRKGVKPILWREKVNKTG